MIRLKKNPLLAITLLTAISLILGSGACTLPSTSGPAANTSQPAGEDPGYTAAAETISAQLTGISNPIIDTPTQIPDATSASGTSEPTPTETFPPTSTPLPTNTPLPSDTPVPTNTLPPSPTSPPTNTPTITKEITDPKQRLGLGEPTWRDTFENAQNWPIYTDEHVTMRITEDQRLQMTSLNADKWESWMLTWPLLQNFYLEVTATTGECSGLDRYGLLARGTADAKNAYLFGLTCDGRFSFRTWNGESFTLLVPWTPSPLIQDGAEQTNRMGLLADGDRFSLYANDEHLITIQDETYTEGLIGLFVGAVLTDGFTVYFDDIAYWELPATE